jgi:hypothetical protein
VEARTIGKIGELVVNDVVVIRFREGQGGFSAPALAKIAATRLKNAIDQNGTSAVISVRSGDPNLPAVVVGNETVISIPVPTIMGGKKRTRAARQRAVRASALSRAQGWANAIRRAMSLPGLVIRNNGLVVPLGENRSLAIAGPARGPITVVAQNLATGGIKRVGVTVDQVKGTVTLSGIEVGRERLTLYREGAVAEVNVAIRPYAALFEMPHTVTVTGTLAPASLITRSAILAAQRSVTLTPGAKMEVATDRVVGKAIKPGQAETVAVPVKVTGFEMIPVERKVFVSVVNREMPRTEAASLLYSNNPEKVRIAQVLFAGRLAELPKTTRLLYHHQSDTEKNLLFRAELVNDSSVSVKVHIMGGDAGPERDTVWVGYRAASDFVQAQESNVGFVVEIPAKSRLPLSSVRLPAKLTISGLMQMQLLQGPAPLVRVLTESFPTRQTEMVFLPYPLDEPTASATATPPLSEHVYPNPSKVVSAEYSVGGSWTFLKFGRVPLASAVNPETVLHGNYGVQYEIAVDLKNPTDRPSIARVVFEPSAGMAGGVFLIGGKRVEIPQIDMPREHTLATYSLAPGESKVVRIKTIPVSGSNYPATIIIRP